MGGIRAIRRGASRLPAARVCCPDRRNRSPAAAPAARAARPARARVRTPVAAHWQIRGTRRAPARGARRTDGGGGMSCLLVLESAYFGCEDFGAPPPRRGPRARCDLRARRAPNGPLHSRARAPPRATLRAARGRSPRERMRLRLEKRTHFGGVCVCVGARAVLLRATRARAPCARRTPPAAG